MTRKCCLCKAEWAEPRAGDGGWRTSMRERSSTRRARNPEWNPRGNKRSVARVSWPGDCINLNVSRVRNFRALGLSKFREGRDGREGREEQLN